MKAEFVQALWREIRKKLVVGRVTPKVQLSVERTVSLGQRGSAAMLNVNGELLLVGVTNSAVTLLHRWEPSAKELEVKGTVC